MNAPSGNPAALPLATSRAALAAIAQPLRERRWQALGVLVLFAAEACTALALPLTVGALVDATTAGGADPIPWSRYVAILAGAALAAGALAWLAWLSLAWLVEPVIAALRERYVAAALALPRRQVDAAGRGDVVSRASDDIEVLSESLPSVLPSLVVSGLTVPVVLAGLGGLDPRYLLTGLVVVPGWVWATRWYLRVALSTYAAERAATAGRAQQVLTTLDARPTVVAHRLAGVQLDRIRSAAWQVARRAMRTRIVENGLFARLIATEVAGVVTVVVIGVWLAADGAASVGSATAAVLLFWRVIEPVHDLLRVTDELQASLASLRRVVGVVDLATERADAAMTGPGGEATPAAGVLVDAAGLAFSYRPGQPVLKGVDLAIGEGEHVALVGVTGSGKSTLADLVAGVHTPDGGVLRRAVPVERIVALAQQTQVLSGTVRDNLTLARPQAVDDELWAALGRVGAEVLVSSLPDGLDTPVGDGGHRLTPEAAQHLALARVLLADPVLVILDEATAEADSTDAAVLDRAARAAVAGRAALVVAHRLSQAAACDRILVMDGGVVVESGDHGSLVAAGGAYARLWSAWSG